MPTVEKIFPGSDILNGQTTVRRGDHGVDHLDRNVEVLTSTSNPSLDAIEGRFREGTTARPADPADAATAAANTAVVITLAALLNQAHRLFGLAYSYSATPTGGSLKVESPAGTTLFSQDITDTKGALAFPKGFTGVKGQALKVTLAAGGSGVVGKLDLLGRTTV